MRKLTIFLIVFIFGCSPAFVIDDRMSHSTTKYFRENISQKQKVILKIDDNLRKLVIQKRPSGFVGGGLNTIFNIGEVFTAYIEQAFDEIYRLNCDQCLNVYISTKEFNLDYTYSATGVFQGQSIPDWVKIETQIDVRWNNNISKTYALKAEVDLPAKDIQTLTKKDRAFTLALEDITKQLITAIVKDMNELKQ